jgi:hypothetical protein
MVNKITMKANCFDGTHSYVVYDLGADLPRLEIEQGEALKIEKFLGHLKRNKRAYTSMAYALAVLTMPGNVFAAGMSGGMSIIVLLQKASFWVGMGITIWGIVEMQLDFPGWRGRILKGVLGYIGILLIPLVFLELQNSLQVDVWNEIQNNGQKVNGG